MSICYDESRMKRVTTYLCILFLVTGSLLSIPEARVRAAEPLSLSSITSLFLKNMYDWILQGEARKILVPPQVGGLGGWGFKLNFRHVIDQISGKLTGISYSDADGKPHNLQTLDNMEQGVEMRDAFLSLIPHDIQEKYIKLPFPDDNSFYHITANHTTHFYDEDGGSCHRPDSGRYTQLEDLGWQNIYPESKGLWAIMSNGSLPIEEMDFVKTLPDEHVSLDNGFCSRQDEGKDIKVLMWGDTSTEEYTGVDTLQWSADHFFSPEEIEAARECRPSKRNPKRSKDNCTDLITNVGANTTLSTNHPGAKNVAKWTGKGADGELEGFTYSILPAGLNLSNEHGVFDTAIALEFGSPVGGAAPLVIEKAVYAYEYGRRQHMDAFNCALTADSLQAFAQDCYFPVEEVNSSPVEPGIRNEADALFPRVTQCTEKQPIQGAPVSHSGFDQATQAAGGILGIPSCILQGVGEIEGATEEMAQSSCIPNQCGATGAFQISVGMDSCGNKTCDGCGPNWKGRACNDESWALTQAIKLTGASYSDPKTAACDVKVAAVASGLVVMAKAQGFKVPFDKTKKTFDPADTKQKQSIITASDAYYGVTSPIARAPLNGLSYGEYVYQKCLGTSTTMTHCDHTFPYKCTTTSP